MGLGTRKEYSYRGNIFAIATVTTDLLLDLRTTNSGPGQILESAHPCVVESAARGDRLPSSAAVVRIRELLLKASA